VFFGSHHGELPSLWPVRCGMVLGHRVAPLRLSRQRPGWHPIAQADEGITPSDAGWSLIQIVLRAQ